MLNVCDPGRAVHGMPHASQVDVLVAALSADPETIEELQAALCRFLPADEARRFFAVWSPGVNTEAFDAGLCVIDLAARLVMIDSTYSLPGPRGRVEAADPSGKGKVPVPYHLAEDWLFLRDVEYWEGRAKERREKRLSGPPLDARAVLYGKVCEFIARAAIAESIKDETIPAIHSRWLMTPRDDLGGVAPRDLLLSRREHLSWDLEDRSEQWSTLGACPPGLAPDTFAYRFGAFGTHEIVLYYNLVRRLLHDCRVRQEREGKPTDFAGEICRLEMLRDQWLETSDWMDLHGRTPASVIARERARLPEGMTGAEAVIDHDCPLCQMMADMPGPVFWHLDGCNMDDDFAFSFHRTREEWEAEQREFEEMDRRAKEHMARESAGGSIWKRSYSNEDSFAQFPGLALFGLGAHLAELTQDLKDAGAEPGIIDHLNRAFGNVREAVESSTNALVDPAVERLCEQLTDIAEAHIALTDKCSDLARLLSAFARRRMDELEWDEEMPF